MTWEPQSTNDIEDGAAYRVSQKMLEAWPLRGVLLFSAACVITTFILAGFGAYEIHGLKAELRDTFRDAKDVANETKKDIRDERDQARKFGHEVRMELGQQQVAIGGESEKLTKRIRDAITNIQSSIGTFEGTKKKMEAEAVQQIVTQWKDDLEKRGGTLMTELDKTEKVWEGLGPKASALKQAIENHPDLSKNVATAAQDIARAHEVALKTQLIMQMLESVNIGDFTTRIATLKQNLKEANDLLTLEKAALTEFKKKIDNLPALLDDMQRRIKPLEGAKVQPLPPSQSVTNCVENTFLASCVPLQLALFQKVGKPENPKRRGQAWNDGYGGTETTIAIHAYLRSIGASPADYLSPEQIRQLAGEANRN